MIRIAIANVEVDVRTRSGRAIWFVADVHNRAGKSRWLWIVPASDWDRKTIRRYAAEEFDGVQSGNMDMRAVYDDQLILDGAATSYWTKTGRFVLFTQQTLIELDPPALSPEQLVRASHIRTVWSAARLDPPAIGTRFHDAATAYVLHGDGCAHSLASEALDDGTLSNRD